MGIAPQANNSPVSRSAWVRFQGFHCVPFTISTKKGPRE